MLTINNADAEIRATNFWQSKYNAKNLAYLSINAGTLRLLIPAAQVKSWLPEILTAKNVIIESPARAGLNNHVDIVFDDGTSNPFSLCIDKTRQIDRGLSNGNTRLIVYAGDLSNRHQLDCVIDLPMHEAHKQHYIQHITVDTRHSRRSPRNEVSEEVIAIISPWVKQMLAGEPVGIIDDKYACRIGKNNSKMAEFVISRVDNLLNHTDIIRAVVCSHPRYKSRAWSMVDTETTPPDTPFLSVKFLAVSEVDFDYLPEIADFERCVAWAWMEK